MDSDNWAGLGFLLAAVALLVGSLVAEAWLGGISGARLRLLTYEKVPGASTLLRHLQRRTQTLAAVALARSLALTAVAATSAFLVLDRYGLRWSVLTAVAAVVLVASGAAQAALRRLALTNPAFGLGLAARLVRLLGLVFRPPTWLLDLPFRVLARLRPFAGGESQADDIEELLRMVEEGTVGDEHKVERVMIRHIISLDETAAREIMVPRIDIAAVEVGTPLAEVVRVIMERGYSRIPLYEESIDNIVGVIYAKDILGHLLNGRQTVDLRTIARPPYFIPEAKKVDELLAEMRQARVHMALVVDEYGGTAGLVTIEDLLEEIVGEIADEFDISEETPIIERLTETEAIVDARLSIDALNELLDLSIQSEDFDTVGGFVYHQLGKVPSAGDEVRVNGLTVRVLSVVGHRIKKVRVSKEPPPENGDGAAD